MLTRDDVCRPVAAIIITRGAHPIRPPLSLHTYPALSTLPAAVVINAEVSASYPLYILPHFARTPTPADAYDACTFIATSYYSSLYRGAPLAFALAYRVLRLNVETSSGH